MLSVDYVRWGLGSVVLCCLLGVLSSYAGRGGGPLAWEWIEV